MRVNAVAPGFIDTRMVLTQHGTHEHAAYWFRRICIGYRKSPLGRPGQPEDSAGAFVFLLSDLSLCVTGQCIAEDGGLKATY